MTARSMLAEVFASANETHFAADGEKGTAPAAGSQEEVTTMADKTPAAAQPKTDTVADLQAAYPALCGQIGADAAKAERERIQGILALPMAGHETLVADAIADGKTTKAEVALGILEAEKATRAKAMTAIKGVEDVAKDVKPAPSAGGSEGKETASTPDGWKAEYEANPNLRAEFATSADYVGFKQAEAAGKVRFLHNKSA